MNQPLAKHPTTIDMSRRAALPVSHLNRKPTIAKTTVDEISMKGGGFYSRRTIGAGQLISSYSSTFLSLLEQTRVDSSRPYAIADYGAADGGTSLELITRATQAQLAREPARPITVYYTDLPGADYGFMFRMLSGLEADFPTYITNHNIFAFSTGISFHRPVFPPNTIDLAFSAHAMHWLSERPPVIEGHIHAVGATGSALNRIREIARKDWEAIIAHRAREMRRGARMLMLNFAATEDGRHLGKNNSRGVFETLNDILKDIVDDGIIDSKEYQNTNFAQYYRTTDEFSAPFSKKSNTKRGSKLILDCCEIETFKCPYRRKYDDDKDSSAFSHTFVDNIRSWSESTLRNSLSQRRHQEEKDEILNEIYRRYRKIVQRNPSDHNMDYIVCKIIFSKY